MEQTGISSTFAFYTGKRKQLKALLVHCDPWIVYICCRRNHVARFEKDRHLSVLELLYKHKTQVVATYAQIPNMLCPPNMVYRSYKQQAGDSTDNVCICLASSAGEYHCNVTEQIIHKASI